MSCDVAVLPYQAHANYETWSIDFAGNKLLLKPTVTKILFYIDIISNVVKLKGNFFIEKITKPQKILFLFFNQVCLKLH